MTTNALYPTISPSLDLNFLRAGVLDSRVTFTRSSTATYFNSFGTLSTALTNVPRFDYNPSTLAAQGLLIEESRANLLSYSEDFGNAAWTKIGSTISTDTTTAPTGTVVADSLIEDTSTGNHRTFRTVSGTTNTNSYTLSVFAKANTRTRIYMAIVEGATFSRQGSANFDLSAGNVISFSTGINGATGGFASITAIGNGWYRCTYTVTLGGTDTAILTDFELIDTGTNRSYTGNGTSGLFLWGAQLEAGAFPTSYIPTTTVAVTRSADVASVNTLTPWWNSSEGTFYVEGSCGSLTNSPVFVMPHDGTSNNYLNAPLLTTAGLGRLGGVVSGAAWANVNTANSTTANTTFKSASAFKASDQAICLNAGTVATGTNASVPVVTTLKLGDWRTSGNAINGYLRRITYFPARLTNANLQAITT